MLRDYAEAQRVIDRALIAIPQLTNRFQTRKADICLLAGNTEAARAALQSLPADYKQGGGVPYLWARLARWTRDYAEANRVLAEVPMENASTFTKAWVARDQALVALAQNDVAKTQAALHAAQGAWRAQLDAHGDEAEVFSWLALWDAALENKHEALQESQKAVDLRPLSRDATNAPVLLIRQALVYAHCGERELALKQLERLVKIPGGPSPGELKFNPDWDALRGDARFQKIVVAAAEPIKID
jgi:tetratricopeptide (TPR) repeat protein